MGEMETLSVDIVVPLYNDEEVVELLCETVLNTIGDKFRSVRLILVDDGSKDGTNHVARKISQEKEEDDGHVFHLRSESSVSSFSS